jgi:hypothetical protein
MADGSAVVLRRIAAELRGELSQIDRTVLEVDALLETASSERVRVYATAALLDTFYTGVEKAFRRIAGELGGIPEGAGAGPRVRRMCGAHRRSPRFHLFASGQQSQRLAQTRPVRD